jgi:hypothetical protein
LTLSTRNIQADTAAREHTLHYPGRCHPHTNMFQCQEQRLLKAECVTTIAYANAGWAWWVWTPANEDVIIAAVEMLIGSGTITTHGPQSTL